jgi:Gpi18-like mannosyltransferase
MDLFASWINYATNGGIRPFYNFCPGCDYPPFNVYIFWGLGSLAKAIGLYTSSNINYLIKLIPNLFDLATAGLIYIFVRAQLSFKKSLLATALYAFNPAVIFNAAVWGQWDAIYTFFLVLSLMFALKSKPKFSAVAYAIGILIKPQAIALAPLIVFLIYRKSGIKNILISIVTFAGTIILVILPFEWGNPVTFLSSIYFRAYGGYQFVSSNAFNLWGLLGMNVPDGNLFILGWAMFGALSAGVLYVMHKRFTVSGDLLAVFCAFMLFFGFFMLPTRIHERYMFPAISMLALAFPFMKKTRPLFAVLTGTLLVNQAAVLIGTFLVNQPRTLSILNNQNLVQYGNWLILSVSLINVVALIFAIILMFGFLKRNDSLD